jgi:hypothetical protein
MTCTVPLRTRVQIFTWATDVFDEVSMRNRFRKLLKPQAAASTGFATLQGPGPTVTPSQGCAPSCTAHLCPANGHKKHEALKAHSKPRRGLHNQAKAPASLQNSRAAKFHTQTYTLRIYWELEAKQQQARKRTCDAHFVQVQASQPLACCCCCSVRCKSKGRAV